MRELIEIIKGISNIQFLVINSLLAVCLLVRTVFFLVSKNAGKTNLFVYFTSCYTFERMYGYCK